MHANTVRPTTLFLVILTTAYAAVYRFIPYDAQTYFLWPLAALGLFNGARLKFVPALAVSLGVHLVTDVVFYVAKQWDPVPYVYPCLLLNVALGRYVLSQQANVVRVLGSSVVSFVVFFLVTNIGSWLETALPEYRPHTVATMLLALEQGLEYIRLRPGHFLGTPIVALILFGADQALERVTSTAPENVR